MSLTLYELTDNYQQLLELADEADPQAFEDTLNVLEDEINHKAENIAKVIKTLEAEAKALEEEKKRLENRITSRKNKIQRLKDYLQDNLEKAGIQKVKGKAFTVWIQNSERVQVTDENTIPEQYFVLKRQLSKSAIKEAIENGQQVAGAEIVKNTSIRIR